MPMRRLILPLLILLFVCAACYGQIKRKSFEELTPGSSTRSDVESALGQPTRQVTEHLLEYRKAGRLIYVQYSNQTPLAIRLQVIYSPPAARAEILSALALPRVADLGRANKQGALEEYFGSPNFIVLTYEAGSQTQVSQVGYYSPGLFESATPELPGHSPAASTISPVTQGAAGRAVDIPSLNANIESLRLYEGGQDSPPVEQREYKDRFPKPSTRGVFAELRLQFPDPGSRKDYSYEVVFHRDGAVYYRRMCSSWIEAGWTSSYTSCGVGWAEAGNWPTGLYLVELFIEGRKLGARSFEV